MVGNPSTPNTNQPYKNCDYLKLFTCGSSHKFQGKVKFETFVSVTKKYATTKIVAKI